METALNCYTFTPVMGGFMEMVPTLEIDRARGLTRWHVPMMDHSWGFNIRIQNNVIISREGNNRLLRSASVNEADDDTLPTEASFELVPLDEGSKSTLLRINSQRDSMLRFHKDKPLFRTGRMRVGAEGVGLRGETHAEKEDRPVRGNQFFSLEEGQYIFFFDSQGFVGKITARACGEQPDVCLAEVGEVAEHILEGLDIERDRDRHHFLAFKFARLQELGLVRAMDQFESMFPGFETGRRDH